MCQPSGSGSATHLKSRARAARGRPRARGRGWSRLTEHVATTRRFDSNLTLPLDHLFEHQNSHRWTRGLTLPPGLVSWVKNCPGRAWTEPGRAWTGKLEIDPGLPPADLSTQNFVLKLAMVPPSRPRKGTLQLLLVVEIQCCLDNVHKSLKMYVSFLKMLTSGSSWLNK